MYLLRLYRRKYRLHGRLRDVSILRLVGFGDASILIGIFRMIMGTVERLILRPQLPRAGNRHVGTFGGKRVTNLHMYVCSVTGRGGTILGVDPCLPIRCMTVMRVFPWTCVPRSDKVCLDSGPQKSYVSVGVLGPLVASPALEG